MALPEAMNRRQPVPGVGPWTAAETLQRTLGAADALTLGDLHLLVQVGYALTGDPGGTDEQELQLLEPYAGQGHRAARLILLGRATSPPARPPSTAQPHRPYVTRPSGDGRGSVDQNDDKRGGACRAARNCLTTITGMLRWLGGGNVPY
nr:hypothetical protein [Streptomyces sp. gb14]